MKTREEKRAAKREKLATIRHRLFGRIVTDSAPGTVFDPLPYLACPGRFRDCLAWWAYKAARAGVGEGMPRRERESAIEDAAQNTLQVFLDRDYDEAGITADEPARAVMGAAAFMARAQYRLPTAGDAPRSRDRRLWFPYNRARNAGAPSPAAIVQTSYNAAEDRAALLGDCDDMPGEVVSVPGGPSGRGLTDGKMVPTVKVLRTYVLHGEDFFEVETGWKMDRKRGRKENLPPCTVNAGKPMPRNRFTPPQHGPMAIVSDGGERCMIPAYAPDVAEYRAALQEYYAGK